MYRAIKRVMAGKIKQRSTMPLKLVSSSNSPFSNSRLHTNMNIGERSSSSVTVGHVAVITAQIIVDAIAVAGKIGKKRKKVFFIRIGRVSLPTTISL